jgi:1-deoxy-D-xylulose-5-phosphate reductoisomerase
MGLPTMEVPILFALSHPERTPDATLRTFDPVASSPLTFEEVDQASFPLLGLGVSAGRTGGLAPATFNAANEVAVAAFLEERIRFPEIALVVAGALDAAEPGQVERLEDVLNADRRAREAACRVVEQLSRVEARGGA